MNIVFMGQKQAGCVGLLAVMALGHTVEAVVAYDPILTALAQTLKLPIKGKIADSNLRGNKLLMSVHGKEIVPMEILELLYWGGINVHPFPFKGSRPIERLLEQGGETVYLRAYRMGRWLDEGEILAERIINIKGLKTSEEVYNKLYPSYAAVVIDGLSSNCSWVAETEMSAELRNKEIRELGGKCKNN